VSRTCNGCTTNFHTGWGSKLILLYCHSKYLISGWVGLLESVTQINWTTQHRPNGLPNTGWLYHTIQIYSTSHYRSFYYSTCYRRRQSNPFTGLDRPLGLQEVEDPRVSRQSAHEGGKLSALNTGHLYPQEIFLVILPVGGWVDPRAIVRLDGSSQLKIPFTRRESNPRFAIRAVSQITVTSLKDSRFVELPKWTVTTDCCTRT
jgi:hypothetical protein